MRHRDSIFRSVLAWLALAGVGALTLLIMLVTPSLRQRRRIGRKAARIVLACAGVRLAVRGGGLPERCVIVANHSSYLDGLILAAALPPRFGFVIKQEMRRVPLAGLLLRRIGAHFVDRVDRHRGAIDTRRLLRHVSAGEALVFFPEGTFSKRSGLLRFHAGAFATAVRADCTVVPVVIRGAARALSHDRMLITPGPVEVELLAPLHPTPGGRDGAMRLRDEAWRRMSMRLDDSHVAPVLPADFVQPM